MKILLLLTFIGVANCIHIQCNFTQSTNWEVIGTVYTCQVTSMQIPLNTTTIGSYEGAHLSGMASNHVKMLYWANNQCPGINLQFVPKGFSNFFPNVIGYHLNKCPIYFLNGDEFDEYPYLQHLTLVNSNLAQVPGSLFRPTSFIRYIHLGSNKITNVGFTLLDDLDSLERAYFSSNVCISQNAANPGELPALVSALRLKCPEPAKCPIGHLENFVCTLQEENAILKKENKKLKNKIGNLEESNENLIISNEELSSSVESLQAQVESLEAANGAILKMINDLETAVQELSSRPCQCS